MSCRSSRKAAETVDKEKAEKLAKKMKKGEFDMNDLADQLRQMKKMGGMQGVLAMLPGVGKVKDQLAAAGLDDKILTRQEAVISSMTKQERAKPDVINGSRRKRIAAGAGVECQRRQQASENAPPDVRHDEEDGQGRPRDAGPRRACSAAWWRNAARHSAGISIAIRQFNAFQRRKDEQWL